METTSSSLYFCPLCRKPFDQVTSHNRHVQYCRKRAAKKQPPRPKACQLCSKTKSKCDFKTPCTRCVSRSMPCLYGKEQGVPTSAGVADHRGAPGKSGPADVDSADGKLGLGPSTVSTQERPIETALDSIFLPDLELDMDIELPDDDTLFDETDISGGAMEAAILSGSQFAGSFKMSPHLQQNISCVTSDMALLPSTADVPFWSLNPGLFNELCQPPLEQSPARVLSPISSKLVSTSMPKDPKDVVRSLVSSQELTWAERTSNPSRWTRSFIIDCIRSYPRMMLRPDNLPPFIHPIGWGLHFDKQDASQIETTQAPTGFRKPLKPLAACVSIAHVFNSRTSNTDEFLWRIIDGEQQRLHDEMQDFSLGETLAAIQSMTIYCIMRLACYGQDYFMPVENRSGLMMTKALYLRFSQMRPQPSSSSHASVPRLTWEEWILEETIRRIMISASLITHVLAFESCPWITYPHMLPLPSNKTLWEAKSAWAWQTDYDAMWAEINMRPDQPRMESLADLVIAKHGGGSLGLDGQATAVSPHLSDLADALDIWHAGVDGLGMVLTAVVSGV